jgi:hypothetical protein
LPGRLRGERIGLVKLSKPIIHADYSMNLAFGLLWIPAGFLFILLSVAALFLTI